MIMLSTATRRRYPHEDADAVLPPGICCQTTPGSPTKRQSNRLDDTSEIERLLPCSRYHHWTKGSRFQCSPRPSVSLVRRSRGLAEPFVWGRTMTRSYKPRAKSEMMTAVDTPGTPMNRLKVSLSGKSDRTKRNYFVVAWRFLRFLERTGVPIDRAGEFEIKQFLSEHSDRYRATHPQASRDPVATLRPYRCAVLALYRAVEIEVPTRLERYKLGKQDPFLPSTDDIRTMIQQGAPRVRLDPLRARALVTFLSFTGLRIDEAVSLRRSDIHSEHDGKGRLELTVHVKGGKEDKDRHVTAVQPSDVSRAIDAYTKAHKEIGPEDRLFPITARTAQKIVKEAAAWTDKVRLETGNLRQIADKIHPHSFRHYYATLLLRRNVNLEAIRKSLGHASLATTQKYFDLIGADVKAAIAGVGKAEFGSGDVVHDEIPEEPEVSSKVRSPPVSERLVDQLVETAAPEAPVDPPVEPAAGDEEREVGNEELSMEDLDRLLDGVSRDEFAKAEANVPKPPKREDQ